MHLQRISPLEICDCLTSRVDSDYRFVRFKQCLFNTVTNELISTFLYDESIKSKLRGLKPKLEQDFKASVGLDVVFLFLYKECYMDTTRLEILVAEFLRKNFSFLTLDLDDDDLIVSKGEQGFTVKIRLPKQTSDYIKGSKAFKIFYDDLLENHFALFNFVFEEKNITEQKELTLEDIEKFAEKHIIANNVDKVDKVFKISNREYFFGTPIKERPVKIEFLRVCSEEQIIAGTISFFKKREFIKKKKITNENGDDIITETPTPYWTFVLDDGNRKCSCVYFLSGRTAEIALKNTSKMDSLGDGKTVCVVGINDERNGRTSFSVRGISLCTLG